MSPHTTRDHGDVVEWAVECEHSLGSTSRTLVRARTSRRAIVVAMHDWEDEIVMGTVTTVRVWRKGGG